jgi:phenylacetate-coenzyme A ligase PaaK-like adenylate-forming protein
MTKADTQNSWDDIVTDRRLNRDRAERILAEQEWYSYTPDGYQVFSSGGSSGVRGVYVWSWQFYVSAACLAWRSQARAERRETQPGPTRMAVLEAGAPPHASTPLFDVPTVTGMETVVIPAGDPFDEVLAGVAAARPTHLVGYPSVIGRLAQAVLAGELDCHPVRVSTNSEPLLDEDRQAIADAWQAPVHNLWGSTEIGVQAVGCGIGEGLHICEDEVVLERVDDLGDEVDLLTGPCECGSAFARVADIGGRRDDDFRYGSITVPAITFRHVLGTDPHVSEYQVMQTTRGAEILTVGRPDIDNLATSVAAALQRCGLPNPSVKIRPVERIPRNRASGKLKRFIAL